MWLRSFAWRNRNHKQRHQGKTEGWVKGGGGGGTEQVLSSHTAKLALPPVPASLTRTTFMHGKQFLCNRRLIKVSLQENRLNTFCSLRAFSWSPTTPLIITPVLHCPLNMHPACCSLHFEVVHRATELWLSYPPFRKPFLPAALNRALLTARATAPPANRGPFWSSLRMLN